MEALRKAEEEKKKAQTRESATASADVSEPTLEPLLPLDRDLPQARDRTNTDERSDERLREALAISSNRVPDHPPVARDGFGINPGRDSAGLGRGTWPGVASGDPTAPTTERAIIAGAHTVFATKRRRAGNSLVRVASAGALLLFLILAGTAFYYYVQTPTVRPVSAAAIAALPARGPTATTPRADPPPVSVPPNIAAPEAGLRAAPVELRADSALAAPAAGTAARPVVAPTAVDQRPEVEHTAGLLRISRRSVSVALDHNLIDGYAALQRGDLSSARAAYLDALGKDGTSRDALLGLAAVALRQGDSAEARTWYQERLRVDPNDVIAIAGIAALGGDDAADESRLRGLIERQPGVAPLHFALGRSLARQQRWPEAQQQFFDAYRGAADNADYAFNLAVSLDHLGQTVAAADYYRKALALVDAGTPASFDGAAARARLDALSAP